MARNAGRHFLQIPGPTNVPDRVLRAIDFPTMDHRGPEFGDLGKAGHERRRWTSGVVRGARGDAQDSRPRRAGIKLGALRWPRRWSFSSRAVPDVPA